MFGNFLNRCSQKTKLAAITQALNEVMADYKLDLTGYDRYNAESIRHADENLMKDVYGAPLFPFLEFL